MYASMNGWCDIMEYLQSKGADTEKIDKSKRTPLHWAVKSKHLGAVKRLIEFGVDIEARDCDGM